MRRRSGCTLAVLAALSLFSAAGGAQRTASTAPAGQSSAKLRVAVARLQYRDASYIADTAAIRVLIGSGGTAPETVLVRALEAAGYAAVAADSDAMMGEQPPVCDVDLDCALRYGRALGAERVVAGHIAKFSSIVWYLTIAMVDVPAGRIRQLEEIELKGDAADLVPKGLVSVARRFAAKDTARMATEQGASHGTTPALPRLSRADVTRLLDAGSDDRPPDLRDRDLSGLDLSGLEFRRADLSRSALVGTRFSGAQMFGTTLNGANARGADFTGAVLDVAVLRGTDLTRAVLRDASLYATILIGADLTEADLTGARIIAAMADAKLPRATLARVRMGADPGNQPMGVMRSDLTGADLRGADLHGADLRKAKLVRADLTGATLDSADLAGADLNGAILRDIRGRATVRNFDKALNLETAVRD